MVPMIVIAVLALGALTACSDDAPSGPAPGGINGPARVEPNPGANNPADDVDE
ncbi:MAG: hypothetical protein HKN44_03465 [Ilumatobacter sp.]|nr:hypothetical protein [Ilumatobacter sp.]